MVYAFAAVSHFPAVAFKPGKLVCCRPHESTADHGSKTSDFIKNPVGVGKGMRMRPVDRYPFRRMCDGVAAFSTPDIFFFLCCFLFRGIGVSAGPGRILGRRTQQKTIGGYHALLTSAFAQLGA